MAVNWGIGANFPDAGLAFTQGLQQGQQRRKEMETDNALRALVANPNDPNVVNGLAQYDPRAALQIQGQQAQQMRAQQEAQARRGAVRGDPGALEDLAGYNIDDYLKLDKRGQEQYAKGIETIGQLALLADTPEEWDDTVSKLAQADPVFDKYRGRFDLRETVIAQAGQAKEFIDQQQPKYQVIPEGGTLVNTRDPAALAQVGAGGQPAPQQPAQGGVTEEQAAPIISQAMQSKFISPEDFAAIQQALGPNGREAALQWRKQNGIEIGKEIGGKRYVQRGGEWYEAN